MKILNVRIPEELHGRLAASARADGVPLSEYVRSRLNGAPDAVEGVWVAAYSDGSGITVHLDETDALREGVRGSKERVKRIPYGEDIIDHLR